MSMTSVQESSKARFGLVQIGIVVLTLITAAIHFSLLFPDTLFILNGLGYLVLLAAYFLPVPFLQRNRSLVRWAFILYTLASIAAWIAIGEKSWPEGALGYFTKAVEVLLIAFLLTDRRS